MNTDYFTLLLLVLALVIVLEKSDHEDEKRTRTISKVKPRCADGLGDRKRDQRFEGQACLCSRADLR